MITKDLPLLDAASDPEDLASLREHTYELLRRRFVMGEIVPESALSTRSLAAELGVSQMPVRDALSRLAAEGAVEIRSKRRLTVPPMTKERFEDLLGCRLLLEPATAASATAHIDAALIGQLKAIDLAMDLAMESGDVSGYMKGNHEFHFAIYRASLRPTAVRLIETLWLQFGPFMRVVYGRVGTASLVDRHQMAIAALAERDPDGVAAAMHADIEDGMGLIGRSIWSTAADDPD